MSERPAGVSRETTAAPSPPEEAHGVFGARLPLAQEYAGWLADQGTLRGLIGPRETPRLWDRHLLNCAALADLVPDGVTIADLGSGAGLPGLVLAIRRPDLRVTLVEPLLRRTTFLSEVVAALGLDGVEVVRGRAEELHGRRLFDVVTSRALAPLPRLLGWSLPLTAPGGVVLAMKGTAAAAEVAALPGELGALGPWSVEVIETGAGSSAITVVRAHRDAVPQVRSAKRPGGGRRSPGRR